MPRHGRLQGGPADPDSPFYKGLMAERDSLKDRQAEWDAAHKDDAWLRRDERPKDSRWPDLDKVSSRLRSSGRGDPGDDTVVGRTCGYGPSQASASSGGGDSDDYESSDAPDWTDSGSNERGGSDDRY